MIVNIMKMQAFDALMVSFRADFDQQVHDPIKEAPDPIFFSEDPFRAAASIYIHL